MQDSAHSLKALRARVAALDRGPVVASGRFATGHAGLDDALGGGLSRARLHEFFAAEPEDAASLTGFGLMLALCAAGDSPLLWLRTDAAERAAGPLYAPGLVEVGLDPDRLLMGTMRDEAMLLRAAADAARCAGLGALLIEVNGPARLFDLTATRRLMLAAEASGVTLLLLRFDAVPQPSAADTRWQVAAAPSIPLFGAPGHPAFDIRLLRRRAGPDGMDWRLEWNSDRASFAAPALSGALPAAAADRPAVDLRVA